MSATASSNGGLLLADLELPDFCAYGSEVPTPGAEVREATRVLGAFLRDIIAANPQTFRIFGPDETSSNRLQDVFEVTSRTWEAEIAAGDVTWRHDGRVMEMLSEHQCQGWLEGYLLTGRHGLFNCYEAFIHIVDSMFNQHAKWLKSSAEIPWRRPIASLNYLLSSHVWRQDNNGFSHQDPGFIDHVVNKKAEIVRVYFPPDANCLLSVADHCLRSRDYVNVIVAGKQPQHDWLTMDEAVDHCTRGLGIWPFASNDEGGAARRRDGLLRRRPDARDPGGGRICSAAAARAEGSRRQRRRPDAAPARTEHPHGLPDAEFDTIFTPERPVIFAYHGYPSLIHRLTYRRTNHDNIHVRGYKEEGTTTTPFDMVMLNDLDRFHLVIDVLDRVPGLGRAPRQLRQQMVDARLDARRYGREHGEDPPEIANWRWES